MASDETIAFVSSLLKLNPKRRLTAMEGIQSTYFSTMPLPNLSTACTSVLDKKKKLQPEPCGNFAAISSMIDAVTFSV